MSITPYASGVEQAAGKGALVLHTEPARPVRSHAVALRA